MATADNKQVKTLFAAQAITDYLSSKTQRYTEDLARWDPDRLLTTAPEDVAADLLRRHGVESPTLGDPDGQPDSVERTVNFGNAYSPFDARRKVTVYRLAVPFTGNAQLFNVRPTTFSLNPPAGHVDAPRATLTIEFVNHPGEAPDPQKIGQAFAETIERVNWHLEQHRISAEQHNARIAALEPVQQRIAAIKADREILSRIPLPKKGSNTQG